MTLNFPVERSLFPTWPVWRPERVEARFSSVFFVLLFPKVLNSTEDAHLKSMSTFETDEHLQGSAFCLTCRRSVKWS